MADWEQLSRAYLQGFTGWDGPRLDSYLATEDRMDARQRPKAAQCSTGYACGTSCISRAKDCRVKVNASDAQRLRNAVRKAGSTTSATALGRNLRGPNDAVAKLLQQRDALVASGKEMLERRRDDNGATLMEQPTKRALSALQSLDRRVRRVDKEISRLAGKNPGLRRWQTSTPGLPNITGAMGPPFADTPGRRAYREQLINEALAEGSTVGRGTGGRPLAVVMMGGPASGKSSMLDQIMADRTGFVSVDPDGMKEKLPEYLLAVANSDRTAAARAHEESSTMIADVLKARAIEGGFNVLLDGTGKNAAKYEAMMKDLKGRGYEVRLMMPHLPLDEGVRRVAKRAHRNGRYVPEEVVEGAYRAIPRNFERLAKIADSAELRDGMAGMAPIMRYEAGRIVDEDATKASAFRRDYGGGR